MTTGTVAVRRGIALFGALTITAAIAGILAENKAPTPKTSIEVDRTYLPHLNAVIDLGSGNRVGALYARAGEAIRTLGVHLAPRSRRVRTVSVTVLGPQGEGPGATRKIAHLTYAADTLLAATRDGSSAEELLGLADQGGTWGVTNIDIVEDYCRYRRSSEFCSRIAT